MKQNTSKLSIIMFSILFFLPFSARTQTQQAAIDKQVKAFLDSHRYDWHDMNIPYVDGRLLFDIIVKHGYKQALEIGTSTGHSTIWIAWAMSKTGGKVTTIEIDKGRYLEALANIKAAGLSNFVEAHLADAHKLVKELEGPFDFVFSDADKSWYIQYFKDVEPKLIVGGCFTAHNVRRSGMWSRGATGAYLKYVESLKNFTTTVDERGGGVAISYKQGTK